mgnify:CR=1 FL=1
MELLADWTIVGQISDKRELRASKGASAGAVFLRVFKVLTVGATFECACSEEMYNSLDLSSGVTKRVVINGRLALDGYRVRLDAVKISKAGDVKVG